MKTTSLVMALLIIVTAFFAGCAEGPAAILSVDKEGNTSIDTAALEEAIGQEPVQAPAEAEMWGIVYMREEEKLARDVYAQLYDKWGTRTFGNIGASEQTHMDAVATLIERYSLEDPARDMDMGIFRDQKLQQMYYEMMSAGGKSETEALKVGAAIEEIDILDLEEYISQTGKQDIVTVYESLLKGSRNHLRSFVSVMQQRGVDYQPQYLSAGQYAEIVSGPIERGSGGQGGGK